MEETQVEEVDMPDRWTMIRDIAVLQFKLVVDGLRDFLLVPASIIVGVISLVSSESGRPAPYFYQLLAAGKQSERWINLFGALGNAPKGVIDESGLADTSIDDLVAGMETFVVNEYKRGGVTSHAKKRIDDALDVIQRAARARKGDDSEPAA